VKLTGKTSRWNYGALTAVTSREYGTSMSRMPPTPRRSRGAERKLIEPRSIYSVARVSRNLLGDTSNVGLIATNVTRELDADASLAGVDATLRRDRNRFNLNGHAVATHAPLTAVVRNGFGGVVNVDYTTKYYNVNGHLDRFSPSFRNSDMGFFFARPDKNEASSGVFLYQPDPKGFVRNSTSMSSADASGTTITCRSADGPGSTETSTSRTSGTCSSGLSVARHSTTMSARVVDRRFCRPLPVG
jgi:hypothetical protein